jgi:outer membrane receptor for ferrienterochelin and colicins
MGRRRSLRGFRFGFLSLVGVLVFVALSSLVPASVSAQASGAAAIRGKLIDPQGKPVSSATVTLRNTLSGTAQEQKSTSEGEFKFGDLAFGSYSVSVQSDGFADQVKFVELTQEHSTYEASLTLALAGVQQVVNVVSASRVEELQETSATPIDVIDRHTIETTGKESAGAVLSELPGVVTRNYSSFKQGVADEQVQGIDSRQVLVLRDGLPIGGARGINSGVIDLNQQPIGNLEQIEVVKGAASAEYGTDAIGGVINLVSREQTAPLAGEFSTSGGLLGTVDLRGNLGAANEHWSGVLDLERHQGDSYRLIASDPSTTGPEYRQDNLYFRGTYRPADWAQFGFSTTAYHTHDVGNSFTETGLSQGNGSDSEESFAGSATFQPTRTTNLQLRGYEDRYDENLNTIPLNDDGSIAGPGSPANLAERYHRGDATVSQVIGRYQLLQGGYEWAQDLYRGVNRVVGDEAGQQITTNDVWLQDRIQPISRLLVTLGVRYQNHSLYGDHTVPRAGVSFRANQHVVLRASYGGGFRAPDLGQLYYRFQNPASFYQVIGNPNLRPETSRSFNGGADFRISRLRLSTNIYRNDVNHLIDYSFVGMPETADELNAILTQYNIPASFDPVLGRAMFVYVNLNRVYTQGVELSGSYALNSQLMFSGAYTYLDAKDKDTGLELTNRHHHQGYIKAEYYRRRWGLLANVRGRLFSDWLIDPTTDDKGYAYRIWDVYMSKSLVRGLSAFGTVENLFDSRDEKLQQDPPTYDRPDYGRTFRIGLRYTFARE